MHDRRIFVKRGAVALLALGFAPEFLAQAAAAATRRRKVLVVVFQRGAVDGLSMVVPHGDAAYYAARPTIAVPRPGRDAGALDLDGHFGLHPGLAQLHALYRNGSLAVVHACGSPDPTRSHFDAQDYMESGTPGVKRTPDGWLNRLIAQRHDAEHVGAMRAVALSSRLPRILQGAAPTLAMTSVERMRIAGGGATGDAFEAQYAAAADRVLRDTGRETFDAMRTLRGVESRGPATAAGAAYPRSAFGDALRQVARLIKADVGLEVAFAEAGGWDTHVNQGGSTGQLATRLGDLGQAIGAFVADLGAGMQDVVVVTMSEFGRTVAENGTRGTDHGHGNAMLVLGGPVRGGRVYGRWPGLDVASRAEGRDVAVTTDFRDVLADVIATHLGVADLGPVFPGHAWTPGRRLGLV
ncbi:hypothetical protein TBR22_A50600 [Luteitalea sp. TBR-22]|uniref:DUF1501 domain-containing protein n=1 Tax=Luteitalea sp. TBR-22 TaxID=2802971 RepID=UPI001AFAC5BA|nr:DUF1501 domain-containing protein [Luteitalea sp. TBR-22]BCS35826.1 hypothetical protein TBR22_A50600 [Luteitalea sp. TBR-22]